MKYSVIFTTIISLAVSSQIVFAGEITDPAYVVGDPLTAEIMNNIRTAVNGNDSNISTNTTNIGANEIAITSNTNAIAAVGDGNSLDASDGSPTNVISTDADGFITVTTGIGINATPQKFGVAASGDITTTTYLQAENGVQVGLISGGHSGLLELHNTFVWSTILRAVNGSSTEVLSLSNSGNMVVSGSVSAASYITTSDRRYKRNIHSIDDPISKISQLRGVSFNWDTDKHSQFNDLNGTHIGFVAQEVNEVIPDIVHKNKDGYLSVEYTSIIPLLVEAVKKQQQTIDSLRKELTAFNQLHADIQSLRHEVNSLQTNNEQSNLMNDKVLWVNK